MASGFALSDWHFWSVREKEQQDGAFFPQKAMKIEISITCSLGKKENKFEQVLSHRSPAVNRHNDKLTDRQKRLKTLPTLPSRLTSTLLTPIISFIEEGYAFWRPVVVNNSNWLPGVSRVTS